MLSQPLLDLFELQALLLSSLHIAQGELSHVKLISTQYYYELGAC
jgi:hypothetical protein